MIQIWEEYTGWVGLKETQKYKTRITLDHKAEIISLSTDLRLQASVIKDVGDNPVTDLWVQKLVIGQIIIIFSCRQQL